MKKLIATSLSALIAFSVANAKTVKLKEPPEELGKYYPPNSDKFEFLTNMYQLSTSFTGVFANMQEKQWDKALNWAEKMKDHYFKIGKLVKKWDKVLRKEAMNNLVEAVKSKDVASVKKYANIVGKTCVQCHKNYQLPTKIKYHFPSFDTSSIEDPVTGVEYGVHDYMKKMTNDMKLLKIYLMQGDKNKAVKSGNNFIKRFEGLQQMCSDCHTNKVSEEIYFSKEIKGKLSTLKEALMKGDKDKVFSSLGYIGVNNCSKCHNVHQIPAMLKEKFEK